MNSYLTFESISIGTLFRITGLKGTDEASYRKMNQRRAHRVQDGNWKEIPHNWPIALVVDDRS